jgi:peroxiredoxin
MKRRISTYVILAASVTLNVLLAYRLSQFNRRFDAVRVEPLKSGTTVPPPRVQDLQGESRALNYAEVSAPTVLYILTPSCSWCARNMDNFKQLVTQRGTEYRFIAVSLSKEDLPEYITSHKLTIPVYVTPSIEMQKAYRLGGTPQTIVVSREGRVVKDWEGAYVGEQKTEVEAFFHVSLPGLRELPTKAASTN